MATEKRQNKCIFCGGRGLSKQHILPDWMSKVFPERHNFHSLKTTYPYDVNESPTYKISQGPLGSKKRRNVCTECNVGWMSTLEQLAKPFLVNLISRKETTFDYGSKTTLSAWVVMTHIMMATHNFESDLVPKTEREYFKKNQLPSENWQIWAAHLFNPSTDRAFKSFPMVMRRKSELKIGEKVNPDDPANFLSSMVNVNNIIFFSRYLYSETSVLSDFHPMNLHLIKLWPPDNNYENLKNKLMLSLPEIDILLGQDFPEGRIVAKNKI